MDENQCGFRKTRSSSMALLVNNLLLKKMKTCGIRGVVYNWLSSYLDKRSQFVCIDNVKSNLLNMLCGVPQGSILGPKLF